MNTHNEKKFVCSKCFKSFAQETGLRNHKFACEDIREISCTSCPKKFRFGTELARHVVRVHIKLRNFKCKLCSKAYTDATPLRHHTQTTHGDGSTFSHCPHCAIALIDTHVFKLNEYFVEFNPANFKVLNQILNWIHHTKIILNNLLNWILS